MGVHGDPSRPMDYPIFCPFFFFFFFFFFWQTATSCINSDTLKVCNTLSLFCFRKKLKLRERDHYLCGGRFDEDADYLIYGNK